MPFVNIEWSPRSLEMRREVAKAVTQIVCEVAGVEPNTVRIAFSEVESDHLAFGGQLTSDRRADQPGKAR